MGNILEVKNLNVDFEIQGKTYPALEDINLKIAPNETIGIVGESGSGKSLTAKSILGILPKNARVTSDLYNFQGDSMQTFSNKDYQRIRGKEISMIFQDPLSSLNPLQKVGHQVGEVLWQHGRMPKKERKERVLDIFRSVYFHDPERVYESYPFELSGGMRQRVVICMALIANPSLLIADEPTTALDTTVQKEVLTILKTLTKEQKNSMLLISHDWGVISSMCDYVYVMYAGRIVEEGETQEMIRRPQHPYTDGLLRAIPSPKKKGEKLYNIPFKVPGITDRTRGEWPYIKTTEANEIGELQLMFPS